jgi:hypothetical protein
MPNEPKDHSVVALLSLTPSVQFTCILPLNTEVKKRGERCMHRNKRREIQIVMYWKERKVH